jgi:hypothetical protein
MCYKHKSNLYTHIKKCKNNESNSETSSSTTDETLPNKSYKLEILKKELKLGKQKEQFFKEKEKIYKKIDDDKDKIRREKTELLNTLMNSSNFLQFEEKKFYIIYFKIKPPSYGNFLNFKRI